VLQEVCSYFEGILSYGLLKNIGGNRYVKNEDKVERVIDHQKLLQPQKK
jgi:hypothetical protein